MKFYLKKVHICLVKIIILFIQLSIPISTEAKSSESKFELFRTNLNEKPKSIDPHLLRSSSVSIFYTQLHRNLLWVDESGLTKSDLAEKCDQISLKLYKCLIRQNLKWSDGSPLAVDDIKLSFEHFLDAKTQAPQADYLFSIKGALDFYKGKAKSVVGLKVERQKDREFILFELESDDSEFLYRLASPVTAIISLKLNKYSGPFYLASDTKESSWLLKTNTYYHVKNINRPDLKIDFIKEPSFALTLFDKKQLDFVSRIPTLFHAKYKNSPLYFEQNLIRLDYNGFGKNLKPHFKTLNDEAEFRKNLSLSLNYQDLQNIFYAPPRPGCFGYTSGSFLLNQKLCYSYDNNSRTDYANIKDLKFIFSSSGGEDHQRAAEWMQNQVKKNLKLNLKVQSLDNQIFLQEYKKGSFIFRRSLTALTPTCLALLETFKDKHLEHLIKFEDKVLTKNIEQMKSSVDEKEKTRLCEQSLQLILNENILIPLGPMQFPYLLQTNWTGIKSNPLFYFDFSELKKK